MRALGFAATFILLFGITYVFLGMVDALPEPRTPSGQNREPVEVTDNPELPVRVLVPSLAIDWQVANPATLDIDELNAVVDQGPLRWPTSAQLGQKGTVALFGHSTRLPVVRNQAYKAFNNIEKLKAGDTISVYSETKEYRYAVRDVTVANATADVVELPSDSRYLTLVTCSNLGVKEDRFVIRADFVGEYAL